jgi:superoxide dismutase, Cu-Zn family
MKAYRTAAHSIGLAALGLAGCVTIDNDRPRRDDDRQVASATLLRGDGIQVGVARISREGPAWLLRVEARGLAPGLHGIHIHAVGRCDPPDFASAQGHWNPAGRAHGSANPAGMHAGDLPNLRADARGEGSGSFPLDPASAGADAANLFDGDGAAVVIHAAPDDLRSDPSGNSGARIACGVLVRG